MPRKPRQNVPGIHHVYARGNDRRAIFRSDADREDYLLLLGKVVERMRWHCLAYCLMDNHVHLLIETREPNLGAGMRWLHGKYASSLNRRNGTTGHVFEGRYGSALQTSDEQLWHTIAYVVRNPVAAGLCSAAEEWRWSSHSALRRGALPGWMDPTRLFRCFEGIGGDPRRRYVEIVG